MKYTKVFLLIVTLITLGIACSTLTGRAPENQEISDAPTQTATQSLADTPLAEEASKEPEDLPARSFEELLEAGVETGDWTLEEGLTQFMKYFVGDESEVKIQDLPAVIEEGGTGIIRMVDDYLNQPDPDPQIVAELNQLMSTLFPPQDILEKISQPATTYIPANVASLNPIPHPQSAPACEELANQGYTSEIVPENSDLPICYLFDRSEVNGSTITIYYPENWVADDDKYAQIMITKDALTSAVQVYSSIDGLKLGNINLVFSILQVSAQDDGKPYNGFTRFVKNLGLADDYKACPITMYPAAVTFDRDIYQQIVAHEVFHCVQDWTFTLAKPQNDHAWWLEGTAHYFSNLVYPQTNREWLALDKFNELSAEKSIFEMSYENFVFFQYLANRYSTEGLIDILDRVSSATGHSAQQNALARVGGMEQEFNRFVVEYLSEGVLDTGGGRITQPTEKLSGTRTIDKKENQEFKSEPFVATRYKVTYKQEKRFLQTSPDSDDGSFSSAEYVGHQNFQSWKTVYQSEPQASHCNHKPS